MLHCDLRVRSAEPRSEFPKGHEGCPLRSRFLLLPRASPPPKKKIKPKIRCEFWEFLEPNFLLTVEIRFDLLGLRWKTGLGFLPYGFSRSGDWIWSFTHIVPPTVSKETNRKQRDLNCKQKGRMYPNIFTSRPASSNIFTSICYP